jgi:undecaprenyl pyrophosphate phosphatase UppP
MMDWIQTYGLGVLLATSFFFFHNIMGYLKASCSCAEKKHSDEMAQILIGMAIIYLLGLLAKRIWGIL